jgi:hypothetical protein
MSRMLKRVGLSWNISKTSTGLVRRSISAFECGADALKHRQLAALGGLACRSSPSI